MHDITFANMSMLAASISSHSEEKKEETPPPTPDNDLNTFLSFID